MLGLEETLCNGVEVASGAGVQQADGTVILSILQRLAFLNAIIKQLLICKEMVELFRCTRFSHFEFEMLLGNDAR